MSVSLILRGHVLYLLYNVSVAAIGQYTSATPKTLELCSFRQGDKTRFPPPLPHCSAYFSFPSPDGVLEPEELFLEIEEPNSLLANDLMTLELETTGSPTQLPMTQQLAKTQHSHKW